ncbi:MAG TPA: hypothetical protein VEN99_06755 [Acidimicrobiia bacterium]|nr:hypothetical protein [Acidimicrobiia bacterium]
MSGRGGPRRDLGGEGAGDEEKHGAGGGGRSGGGGVRDGAAGDGGLAASAPSEVGVAPSAASEVSGGDEWRRHGGARLEPGPVAARAHAGHAAGHGPPHPQLRRYARRHLAARDRLVTTARLFAVLNLAIADDVIAFYDAKYHYAVWRPVTAIREADGDGNPATTGDPNWTPLSATPADPSYPGAHSAVSAAAATEAGLSRIAAGVHTRTDHYAGTRLGRRVAAYVLRQWRVTAARRLVSDADRRSR